MKTEFILNGKKVNIEHEPDATLLNVLRNQGIHSVRSGCETTNCGICTVWIDKTPILSCSYLVARAVGKEVTTIEGVKAEADELIDFMANEGADQCGFCSPGFIMSVLALKHELKNPTEQEIKEYLSGNLCRCTGYVSQMRIVGKFLSEVKTLG